MARSDLTLSKPQPSSEKIEELPSDVSKFWNGETLPDDFFGEVSIPSLAGSPAQEAGKFSLLEGSRKISGCHGVNLFKGFSGWVESISW